MCKLCWMLHSGLTSTASSDPGCRRFFSKSHLSVALFQPEKNSLSLYLQHIWVFFTPVLRKCWVRWTIHWCWGLPSWKKSKWFLGHKYPFCLYIVLLSPQNQKTENLSAEMQQLGWDSILSFKGHLLQANPLGFCTKLFKERWHHCVSNVLWRTAPKYPGVFGRKWRSWRKLAVVWNIFEFFLCIQTSLYLK